MNKTEYATHKLNITLRGQFQTIELRLPLDVTEQEIDQLCEEMKKQWVTMESVCQS